MRLFVALEIPAQIREAISAATEQLKAARHPAGKNEKAPRWTRTDNLHITLKFIGNVAPEKLGQIHDALSLVPTAPRVDIRVHGIAPFPNERRPHVLSATVTTAPDLAPLADEIDRSLEPLGIPRETRAYTPHLTVARLATPQIPSALRAALQAEGTREFGSFRTGTFHLIESKLKPSGAEYTTLHSFLFAREK